MSWSSIRVVRYAHKEEMIRAQIQPSDTVLDVGFWGQANLPDRSDWPHRIIESITKELWGVDIVYDESMLSQRDRYARMSAESFSVDQKFDVIVALDLIEHIPNPGLFLDRAKAHLKPGGRLLISTPNTFNLFVMAGKLTHPEPPINSDHTVYFNRPTIWKLFEKCGWKVSEFGVVYSLGVNYVESPQKKFLNVIYKLLSWYTDKFYETMVVVAVPNIVTKD
jgi:SAM-dependent methyltransferase